MSKPQIKLQKLPQTKPVKHTISVMPDLEADLEAYAKVYENSAHSVNAEQFSSRRCGI